MQVGGVRLTNNVAVAPMSGVSDLPFRRAALDAGAGLVVSEMVASDALALERPDVVRRAQSDPSIRPFAVQLAGRDLRWMAEGARLAEAAGADIVDINMGCPARQVTGQACGSALMRDLDQALRIIDATVAATRLPVTLKMRLGWDRSCLNAADLARRAEAAGVKLFTVHGRTRNEFFTGEADWRAIRAVVDSVRVPVIANGDIRSLDDARTALAQSGAAGVMIGRAAIGRPWLPGAIARALSAGSIAIDPPQPAVQLQMALEQYERTLAVYGEGLGVRVARKHLAAFIDSAPVDVDPAERRAARSSICGLWLPEAVREALSAFVGGACLTAALRAA